MSLNNLPVEWSIQKFEKIVFKIVGGGTPSKNNPEYYLGNIPWMSVKDMNKNILEDTVDHITQEAIDNSATNLIPKGTPIIATRMSLGKVVVANFDSAINQDLKAIFLDHNIDKNFFVYWYRSQSKLIESLGTGTTVKGIRLEVINNLDFPVVPLAEQQEIVRQLDVMFAQVEQIKARLDAIPAILKKFRQSVLADAVSGKLTEEWREGADFDIEAWTYERAEDLCLKVQSGSTPRNNPFDQNGTIPFLKVYNIVDQKISFDYKPQFILEDVHQNGSKRSICKPFDVLMNIVGPPLGKIAIVTDQYPEWNINQAITMFRVNPEKLTYKFLYYVLCEGQIVRDVLHETKGSVGQINISLSQCRDALIPKPSLIEQDAIVETIDSLLGMAEKIENTVQLAQKRVNLLTQSILAKAFSGELTAEWREQHQELITGANSVESLLAKIQAEREVSKPVKKVKKVK